MDVGGGSDGLARAQEVLQGVVVGEKCFCVFACDPEGLGFIELVEKFFGVAGLGEAVFRDKAFEDAAGLLRSLGIAAREEQYVFVFF